MDSKFAKELATTKAAVVITTSEFADAVPSAVLLSDNPEFIFAKCAAFFKQATSVSTGIHPTAVVGSGCNIAEDVSIGAGCVIGDGVAIASGSVLHPNVVLCDRVCLGERVEIFSGAIIGADGFGFTSHNGEWMPIPQLGTVVIGNDVSIGSLTAVDRGALEDTIIEDGVKIDNHVQIAHNVRIGAHTVIAGCTGIAGSCVIGKGCKIGGGTGISDHVTIAEGVSLAAGSRITQSITEPGSIYVTPTSLIQMPASESLRFRVQLKKLPEYIKRLIKLERKINE